jgi:hypothetical protein
MQHASSYKSEAMVQRTFYDTTKLHRAKYMIVAIQEHTEGWGQVLRTPVGGVFTRSPTT